MPKLSLDMSERLNVEPIMKRVATALGIITATIAICGSIFAGVAFVVKLDTALENVVAVTKEIRADYQRLDERVDAVETHNAVQDTRIMGVEAKR